jgi:hypothetical protein
MTQIQLMQLATALPPGHAIVISLRDMMEAAAQELTGLDRIGGPRPSDVREFIAKIEPNWDVTITPDTFRDQYTMYKPQPDVVRERRTLPPLHRFGQKSGNKEFKERKP